MSYVSRDASKFMNNLCHYFKHVDVSRVRHIERKIRWFNWRNLRARWPGVILENCTAERHPRMYDGVKVKAGFKQGAEGNVIFLEIQVGMLCFVLLNLG